VVTGTRIAEPNVQASKAQKVMPAKPGYERFLAVLKTHVRAGDERAVTKLIAYPLRVNFPDGARSYANARSVERDFSRIFTPKVRQAILSQRADHLFVRDQGAMIGDGEVWFSESCADSNCSLAGPLRIIAVNP
jgi:hypothetical protein